MAQAIEDLKAGSDISLVCNAGTPLISDPGLALVEIAVASGISVRHVPDLMLPYRLPSPVDFRRRG